VVLLPVDASQAIAGVGWPAVGRGALALGLGVGLLALLSWLMRDNPESQRMSSLAGGAIAAVVGYLLLTHGALNPTSSRDQAYPETPTTTTLNQYSGRTATLNEDWNLFRAPRATLPPNTSLAYNWRDVQGYDSLYLRSYRSLLNAMTGPGQDASPTANGNIVFLKHADSPLFPLLGAGLLVSQSPLQLPRFQASSDEPPYLYLAPMALPEAYVMSGRFTASDGPGLDRLRRDLAAGPAWRAMLAPESGAPTGETPEASLPIAASLRRLTSGKIHVDAPRESTGLLVLSEGFAPGWRAALRLKDGRTRAATVLRANVAFQAVMVDPEVTSVEWRYLPGSFRGGLFLCLGAVLTLIAGAMVAGRRKRHGLTQKTAGVG
jgi:hypothetical protein